MRPGTVARGKRALVESVMRELGQRVGTPLLRSPVVIGRQGSRQRFDRGLDGRAGAELQPAVDAIHIAAFADEELPPLMRLFDLEVEAGGVDGLPGLGGFGGEPLERPLASPSHPLALIDGGAGLGQSLLEVADDGGGLEADLTRSERIADLRQPPQLLAHTQAVGCRALREQALLGHPAARAVAAELVLAALLGRCGHPALLGLQPVDNHAQAPQIDEIVIRLALEGRHGCFEGLQLDRHAGSLQTFVRGIKRCTVNLC